MAISLRVATGHPGTGRVGAGLGRETFSPDLLEEIRIMAEASQAHLAETAPKPAPPRSPFAQMLDRVLAATRPH